MQEIQVDTMPDLVGTMRRMGINEFFIIPPRQRSSAARAAWELKMVDKKRFSVNKIDDDTIKVTRTA